MLSFAIILPMKKAFTMIELVFVIVVAAILAVAIMPRMSDDSLRQAADQILMHIRYTQHLAMVNDAYDPTEPAMNEGGKYGWKHKWWRFEFTNVNTEPYGKNWRYNVYQDNTGSGNLNSINQAASDPQNPSKYLTAGYSSGSYPTNSAKKQALFKQFNLNLNIQNKFGVTNVQGEKDSGCESRSGGGFRIAFDELGAPYNAKTADKATEISYTKISTVCKIKITNDNNENICILVQPETGYSCIDEDCDGTCDR